MRAQPMGIETAAYEAERQQREQQQRAGIWPVHGRVGDQMQKPRKHRYRCAPHHCFPTPIEMANLSPTETISVPA